MHRHQRAGRKPIKESCAVWRRPKVRAGLSQESSNTRGARTWARHLGPTATVPLTQQLSPLGSDRWALSAPRALAPPAPRCPWSPVCCLSRGGGLTKLSASASAYAPAVHGCASLASRSLDCHPGLKPVRESGRNYQTIRLASFASGPLRPRLGVRSHTMPLVSN